jgi:hypothetical protein
VRVAGFAVADRHHDYLYSGGAEQRQDATHAEYLIVGMWGHDDGPGR